MKARASSIRPVMAQSEHISLAAEPDMDAASERQRRSRVLAAFTLASPFRGLRTELSLLENQLLQIDARRPGAAPQRYIVDLRYANARPVRSRTIAWLWAVDTAILLVLAGLEFARVMGPNAADYGARAWGIGVGAALAAAITTVWFVRSTTESLSFVSAHGGVPLVQVPGGIGSARAGKKFFVQLIRTINEARQSAAPNLRQYLRDEMREHHRLHELGVLSEQQYAASKVRILQAHS